MPFPDILVLRHGQTEWNSAGRMQGQLDSTLTDKGLKDAQTQHDLLTAHFDVTTWDILCSPQPRAMHTAGIALAGAPVKLQTVPELCEINVGTWAGRLQSDIRADVATKTGRTLGPFDHYDNTPGEAFVDLYDRCSKLMDRLTGPTLMITHGVTSRMVRLIAMGWGIEKIADLPGGQGVLHQVTDGQHQTYGDLSETGL